MQKRGSYDPAHEPGHQRREQQKDKQDPQEPPYHTRRNGFCRHFVPHAAENGGFRVLPQAHERNSTSSRWNIFTARNSATAAYTHVDAKMRLMELQWYVPAMISSQTKLV